MNRLLSKLSVGKQIQLIGSIGVIGLLLSGAIHYAGSDRTAEYDERLAKGISERLLEEQVQTSLLEARRREKDFLLRLDPKHAANHGEVMDVVFERLSALSDAVEDRESAELVKRVTDGAKRYQAQFASVVKLSEAIGFAPDQGLMGALRAAVQDVESKLKQVDATKAQVSMLMMRRHEKDFVLRLDPQYVDKLKSELPKFAAAIDEAGIQPALRSDIMAAMGEYQTKFQEYVDGRLELIAATKGLSDIYAELEPQLVLMAERAEAHYRSVVQENEAFKQSLLLAMSLSYGLLLLLIAPSTWFVARSVVRPISAMTGAMQTLAGGDKTVAIPATERRDEIGQMAQAVQVFKDAMIKADEMAAEQEKERAVKEARARRIEEETKAFDTAVGGILETVSAASTELNSTASSMSATAEETSRQATAVAAASEQASTNVQTVASAAEELASSIAEISRQVSQSAAIAGQAMAEANRTNATVKSLAEAAQKIGAVVNLINEIASQTNLLALNATIEAARAGEAGKGFAVVASEVKSLANQTAKATEEIGAQIGAMQSVTGEAVTAIEGIGTVITQINEIATTIASAVEEQGAATQEIARNVQQASAGTRDVSANITGVTQASGETGSAANQVLAASGELSKQADALKRQVEHFLTQVRAA